MSNPFTKAERTNIWVRAAIVGPTGSGKSLTALYVASGLSDRVAVIDTERGSARRYADCVSFDTLELESFSPERYIDAINAAEQAGYPCLIVDSLSHAWAGKDGVLEFVDKAGSRDSGSGGNKWAGWRNATPLHNRLVDALLGYPGHLIVTMRSKMEYVQEKDERGKTVIRKVGMQSIQRDGMEYEFDFVADMDTAHVMHVSKFRCDPGSEWAKLADSSIDKPSRSVGEMLKRWAGGEPPKRRAEQPKPKDAAPPASDPVQPEDKPAAKPEADEFRTALDELGGMLLELDGKPRTTEQVRSIVNTKAVGWRIGFHAALLRSRDDVQDKLDAKEAANRKEAVHA